MFKYRSYRVVHKVNIRHNPTTLTLYNTSNTNTTTSNETNDICVTYGMIYQLNLSYNILNTESNNSTSGAVKLLSSSLIDDG